MEISVIQLVKMARDEVLEETEAWLEGANGNDSKVVIQKILDNLIQSLEEGNMKEDIEFQEEAGDQKEKIFDDFKIGEEVEITASYSASDPRLIRTFGYDRKKEEFGFLYHKEEPKKGKILKKAPNPIVPDEGDVYLIESEGIKFVCHEKFLKKEETHSLSDEVNELTETQERILKHIKKHGEIQSVDLKMGVHLRRLVEKGLVQQTDSSLGFPFKERIYELTSLGEKAIQRLLEKQY